MRLVLALVLMLFAAPALAQYWGHYTNEKFGYELDIPPGFEGHGEAANGEGQGFYRVETEQSLVVWGGPLTPDLAGVTAGLVTDSAALGWGISTQTSTPQWSQFSGVRGPRSFYQRLIVTCEGTSYAALRLDFDTAKLGQMEPVMQGLVRSFVPTDC